MQKQQIFGRTLLPELYLVLRCVTLGKIARKIEIRKEIHYPINYLSIICHCEAATSAAAVFHCSPYQLTPATAVYKYY